MHQLHGMPTSNADHSRAFEITGQHSLALGQDPEAMATNELLKQISTTYKCDNVIL